MIAFALIGLTGCIAFNEDWTQKPATKTDYIPGHNYQLLTNVFFGSKGDLEFVLSCKKLGGSDSMLDAGTRLRVTTVHYNGDSIENGFFTTICAEVINGPFNGTNFNISFLSEGSSAFIARNPNILEPVDSAAPDLNTNHFAWAVDQITHYHGEYTWDWWRHCEEEPNLILPLKFLMRLKQNTMLLEAYKAADTAEGKAYAIAALKKLDDRSFSELAPQFIVASPTINTYRDGTHKIESTASVIASMQQDVEMVYP